MAIEVEKKFQPSEQQKAELIDGATLISKKQFTDDYYDTASYELAKNNKWLRNRDGVWELKVYVDEDTADEITDETEILKLINFTDENSVDSLLESKIKIIAKIVTKREKYNKEGLILDFDETDFGVNKLDIEILVNNDTEKEQAKQRISEFSKKYSMNEVNLPIKPIMYLQKMKPDLYKEIFGNKEANNELIKLK